MALNAFLKERSIFIKLAVRALYFGSAAISGPHGEIFSNVVETWTEWQGIIDVIGTRHYVEITQMRPALETLYDDLLVA